MSRGPRHLALSLASPSPRPDRQAAVQQVERRRASTSPQHGGCLIFSIFLLLATPCGTPIATPTTMSRALLSRCARRSAPALQAGARRSYAAAASSAPPFDWQDPLNAKNLLTEEELAISETAEKYCQEQLLPRVLRTCCTPHNPSPHRFKPVPSPQRALWQPLELLEQQLTSR